MMAHEIMTYLKVNGFGSYGVELWAEGMPNSPNKVICLNPYAGPAGNLGFGTPGLKDEWPGLQVLVRGEPSMKQEPAARAYAVYKKLAEIQGRTLTSEIGTGAVSTSYYKILHPVQSGPTKLEIDASQRYVYAFSYLCEKGLST